MSVNNISPISAKLITNNSSKANNEAKVNAPAQEQKPIKKINKKALAFGAAAAVGVAAIAIGGIIYTRKTAFNKGVLEEAEKIKQKATELLNTSDAIGKKADAIQEEAIKVREKSKNLYDEILPYLEKWDENEPDKVIETSKGVKGVFEAKTIDGKLTPIKLIETKGDTKIRETEIFEFKPATIREFIEGAKNNNFNRHEFLSDGSLRRHMKGYQRCAFGVSKSDEDFIFNNGSLFSYLKDRQLSADGTIKIAERLDFKKGLPYSYQKGWQKSGDGATKIAEQFDFNDGLLSHYIKDYQMSADCAEKYAEEFEFISDSLSMYLKDRQINADGVEKLAEEFDFIKDGLFHRYLKDFQATTDGIEKAAEEYTIKDGKLQKIS